MKNKITYLPISLLTLATAFSGIALTTGGATAVTADATVNVPSACTFSTTGYSWTVSATPGSEYTTESLADNVKKSTATCNDPDGFVVKAAGSPNTNLTGSSTGATIATGTSGNSYWAFKVSSATSTTGTPTYTGYGSYTSIPSSATTIISYPGSSSATVTANYRTDYKIHISAAQPADTYTGGVEYTIVPN